LPAFCWCRIHSVVCSGFGFYAYSLLSCFLLITGLVSLSWLPRMSLLCFRYFRFLCIRFSRNSLLGFRPCSLAAMQPSKVPIIFL